MINSLHPKILYKYRDWKNDYHRRIIENQEMYFSPPSEFNDPFDCSLPFRYSEENFTDDKMFWIIRHIMKRENSNADERELHDLSYHSQDKEHKEQLKDSNGRYELGKQITDDEARGFGIVCLSEKRDNMLMWSHYSYGHTGFCVGFDSKLLKKYTRGEILPIVYPKDNKFPDYEPLSSEKDLEIFMRKLIGTKSEHWKYEEEYRLFIQGVKKRCRPLPKNVFKEVIFGAKMEEKLKVAKAEWLKTNFPHIEIYEAKLDKETFKLNIEIVFKPLSHNI